MQHPTPGTGTAQQGSQNRPQDHIDAILDKAATCAISVDELELLVNKTRELQARRQKELQALDMLLSELEARRSADTLTD